MTKHLADHRAASDGGRLLNFLRVARGTSSAAPRTLQQRPQVSDDAARLQHYLRIARSQQSAD